MNATSFRDGEPMSEINTTPLIDVMLVLLIMLIVTLDPPALAVKLDTPQPSKLQALVEPDRIAIGVDFDGAFAWNGEPITRAELDLRLQAEASRDPQPEIHIQPHRLAKYGSVAHVMSSAQRNHLTRLGIIGGT
jgi:biopolymer transport protein ExbD